MLATSATPLTEPSAYLSVQSCRRAQLRQIVLPGVIDQGVFVNPADAGGVRAQGRRDAGRQGFADAVEIFQHPGPRPIKIGAVLENDVNERPAEHGKSAHGLDLRRAEKAAGDRIGDLVLDQRGTAPFPIGVNDDLHVGKIGHGIERNVRQRIKPGARGDEAEQADQERIASAGIGDLLDQPAAAAPAKRRLHGRSPHVFSTPWMRLSASMRKLALETTRSPSFKPETTS